MYEFNIRHLVVYQLEVDRGKLTAVKACMGMLKNSSVQLVFYFYFFLVPLTPPLDLTVQSNGAYQVMVKWKVRYL